MRIVILTLTFFTSAQLFAQNGVEKSINFRFVCGAGATTSESITECKRLIASKNYVLLRGKLFSDNLEEAILAAVALKELMQQQSMELSSEEQAQISHIEGLDHPYSVCYTCTQHFEGTVKDMFKRRYNGAYSLIKFAIFHAD